MNSESTYRQIDRQDQDRLYAQPQNPVTKFKFDNQVAKVFSDMVRRSVPGYQNIIDMIGLFARRFVTANSNCYDLGTSLGAVSLSIAKNITSKACTIYAIDNSLAMIEYCKRYCDTEQGRSGSRIQYVLADVQDIDIFNTSFVVLNFTLQFLPIQIRQDIVDKIFAGLLPGGVLILSEKVCFDDDFQQELLTELHEDFKRMMGYSELEISQKRKSLEKALVPNTPREIGTMFDSAGFVRSFCWFKNLHFHSFFAQK